MKRKVIQIAKSTQLISLPRKWCIENAIKKGDELEVEVEAHQLSIRTRPHSTLVRAELSVSPLRKMTQRCLHALYKKGVDEILVHYETTAELGVVQAAIGKETAGYEIVEQGASSCLIKQVSGGFEEFDGLLRRTFLLLLTMADDGLTLIINNNRSALSTVITLEETNNRFTTICRRYLNKQGTEKFALVGPLYTIVEGFEKLADQYKYIYLYLTEQGRSEKLSPAVLQFFRDTNTLLRTYYGVYYKYSPDAISQIGQLRKTIVAKWYELMVSKNSTVADKIVLHSLLEIAQSIFNYTGPLLVLSM